MTSGPMPIGALSPERTPDPQVVAWMEEYRRGMPDTAVVGLMRAYRDTHSPDGTTSALLAATGIGLRELKAAAQEALKPLTVADIPAGQGAASLFLMTRYRPGSTRSHWQLIYKREDGTLAPQVTPAGPEDAVFAVLQHLAATLPIVTAEEA